VATPTIDEHTGQDVRMLHAAALMALFCVGVYAAAFGPALPFIAEDLGVSLDTSGLLLTALFAGSITASATVAVRLHFYDTRLLSTGGLACATAGALIIGLAPAWPLALAGGVLLGFGDGFIVAALHILMAATSREVPRAINRLNLYFAFGAVAGPIWAGAVLATTGERSIVFGGVAAVLFTTLLLMLAASPSSHAPIRTDEEDGLRIPGTATAWIMGALLFLYVGAEFGLGSWVSSYARESADAGVFQAALLTAGYWFALMCGRLVSAQYFARGHDSALLLAASVAGAGISSVVLAATTGNIAISAVAAFGAGLCLGPVWPSTVAIASEGNPAAATATTVTIGNAGGLAIPWLQGKVLVGAGPTEGVVVTAVLCAMMFGIACVYRVRRT
jgi:fucose permease